MSWEGVESKKCLLAAVKFRPWFMVLGTMSFVVHLYNCHLVKCFSC